MAFTGEVPIRSQEMADFWQQVVAQRTQELYEDGNPWTAQGWRLASGYVKKAMENGDL